MQMHAEIFISFPVHYLKLESLHILNLTFTYGLPILHAFQRRKLSFSRTASIPFRDFDSNGQLMHISLYLPDRIREMN